MIQWKAFLAVCFSGQQWHKRTILQMMPFQIRLNLTSKNISETKLNGIRSYPSTHPSIRSQPFSLLMPRLLYFLAIAGIRPHRKQHQEAEPGHPPYLQ